MTLLGGLLHDLGLLAKTPEATRRVGGAGRPACNQLRYPSPQAHEQENEELAFLISFKNVQVRYHICICKAGKVSQKILGKMHFLLRFPPSYRT